jgi:hypothetical protein
VYKGQRSQRLASVVDDHGLCSAASHPGMLIDECGSGEQLSRVDTRFESERIVCGIEVFAEFVVGAVAIIPGILKANTLN